MVLKYAINVPSVLFQLAEAHLSLSVKVAEADDEALDSAAVHSSMGHDNEGAANHGDSEVTNSQSGTSAAQEERHEKDAKTDELLQAIQRSKADVPAVLSGDNVVLLKLTRMARTKEVLSVLLESEALLECRRRVLEAGCEITPSWASGAKLFVPCTESQVLELEQAGFELMDHHVLALREDKEVISQALKALPKKKRPNLSCEHGAPGDERAGPAADEDGPVEVIEEYMWSTDSSLDFPSYHRAACSSDTSYQ